MTATAKQPSLADLTQRLIRTQVAFVEAAEPSVELHDGASGFRVDPRTAWDDATYALTAFGVKAPKQMPDDWAFQANLHATSPAIPLAAGTFPQRLTDLAPLLNATDYAGLLPKQGNVLSTLVRPAGDASESYAANEKAAALWAAGRTAEALAEWQAMPAGPVASFNVGMALLFLGRPADAVPHLTAAGSQLPDSGGWNHLAKLYLSLAQMRR